MKKSQVLIFALLGLITFVLIAIVFFTYTKNSYIKNQDRYFTKVSYIIEGRISSSKLIGGVSYLIEIEVDTSNILKNELSVDDDFVGLYDQEQNKIYIIADIVNDSSNETISNQLKYIKINTFKKEVMYLGDSVQIELLKCNSIYKHHLVEIETKNMIRF